MRFLQRLLSKLLQPGRVFIALIAAVVIWLLPVMITSSAESELVTLPFTELQAANAKGAYQCEWQCVTGWYWCRQGDGWRYGQCCDDWACVSTYQPPSITAALACSIAEVNGWCSGALTMTL